VNPWSLPVDLYCERLVPGLWAEPLNLVSNLAFAIAGMLGVRWMRGRSEGPLWVLVGLTFAIALGSALFHSIATTGAMLADVLPIALYLVTHLGVLTRHLLRLSWRATFGAFGGFGALTLLGLSLVGREASGGSNGYFGAAVALLIIAVGLRARAPVAAKRYGLAGGAFVVSLVFRSIDLRVCSSFPIGTHFLWHLLNGLVIALTLRAAIGLLPAVNGSR